MERIAHPSVDERKARGKAARQGAPAAAHAGWEPHADRPDPVALIDAQNATREPDLVPVRHGRMMASPFTFYRGTAKVMAADLKDTPTAGLHVQLCGDAHVSNFGVYASPERTLLFDLNDFDETLPGPFEYDVKRLATSIVIAARNNGFSASDARAVVRESITGYREAMVGFAAMGNMDLWYARVSEQDILRAVAEATRKRKGGDKDAVKAARKRAKKVGDEARARDHLNALSTFAEMVDGRYQIKSKPPFVVRLHDVGASRGMSVAEVEEGIHDRFRAYRETLADDRRQLLERFEPVDVARKVGGVGSVGTRTFIMLLQGRDHEDPLFLQVKQATTSVLEDHLPKSRYTQPGERVVQGQRLMQSAGDILLGWTEGVDPGVFLYWRQLGNMNADATVEDMSPESLAFYARVCGETLARAHARSGDPIAIAEYLGKKDRFDESFTDFAERYADQTERDYQAFLDAVRGGRLAATEGV